MPHQSSVLVRQRQLEPKPSTPGIWQRLFLLLSWALSLTSGAIALFALSRFEVGVSLPMAVLAIGSNPKIQLPDLVRLGMLVFVLLTS